MHVRLPLLFPPGYFLGFLLGVSLQPLICHSLFIKHDLTHSLAFSSSQQTFCCFSSREPEEQYVENSHNVWL